VGIVVLVVLAPTLVSWTIGRSIVASALRGSINGDIQVASVRFGWTAPQRIDGLRIDDRAGGNQITARVAIDRSLLSLVTNPMGELDVTAAADISTTQAADGSLGLEKIAKSTPSTPTAPRSSSPLLPSTLVISLTLEPSSVTIDQGADGRIVLSDLGGTARFAAADGSIKADLKGMLGSTGGVASGAGAPSAAAGGATGPVALRADLKRVIDADANPTIGATTGTASLTAGATQLRYGGATSTLKSLEVTIDAKDATQPLTIAFAVAGAQRETIEVADLAGRGSIGRDAKGPMGLSIATLAASIDRGELTVRDGPEPFTAKGLKADLALGVGGRAAFTLAAETAIGSRRGSIAGEGSLDKLFDEKFQPTLAVTTGTAKLTVQRAVVPAGPVIAEIDEFVATIDAQRVDQPIRLTANGRGTVRDSAAAAGASATGEPTSIATNLILARDSQSALGISTDLRTLSGDLEARSIPSAILRPFIPAMGDIEIDPVRDIGPLMNITAKAAGGASAPISLSVQSQRLKADLSAMVDPASGSVRDGQGRVNAMIAPELLAKTPIRVGPTVNTTVDIKSFSMPMRDGAPVLDQASIEASATVDGLVTMALAGRDPIPVSGIRASLRTPRLADGANIGANAVVDGVPAQIAADLSGLAGVGTVAFKPESIRAKGTLAAGPVNWAQPPAVLRPAAERVIALGLGLSQTTVGMGFDGGMSAGAAQVKVIDGTQAVTTNLDWNTDRVRFEQTTVNATLTNALLDGFGISNLRFVQPSPVVARIEPIELARAPLERGEVVLPELKIGVTAATINLVQVPGNAPPVALTGLDTNIGVKLADDIAADVKGTLAVVEGAGSQQGPVATMDFTFSGTQLAVDRRQWQATVNSKDVEAHRLMALAGIDPKTVPGISSGQRGTLAIKAGTEANGAMGVQFDSAIGATRAEGKATRSADGALAIPTADLSITLDAASSTAFFATEKDAQGRQLITRASALPITLSLRDVLVPAPRADGSLPLARAKANATLTTGNLDLELARLGQARVGAVDGKLVMTGDGRKLDLRATSSLTTARNGAHPMAIQIDMTDFSDAQGELDWKRMTLAGNAKMLGLPVALLDVFMDGDGAAVDAIGPLLDADVVAVSPSGSTGSVITGTLKSEFLAADLGRIAIEDSQISIGSAAPLSAALIPNSTVRQRLLKPINPILADIRPQEGHPIVFTVEELSLPTTMAMRDLNGHFTMTIGDVELQRSGSMLNLMRLVQEDDDGIIPGNISPLDVTVRNGLLSYDNFTISMGRIGNTWNQQIFSSGDVDIGSNPMYATAINVDYPVAGIGRLAAGATRFDAFFGRVNKLVSSLPLLDSNMIRVRATFSGPIEPNRELAMAFEPVLVTPPGTNPIQSVVDGIFGDKGILRIPSLGGSSSGDGGAGGGAGGGSGGGSSSGGSGGDQPASKPKDPIRGIFDDIFKKKK